MGCVLKWKGSIGVPAPAGILHRAALPVFRTTYLPEVQGVSVSVQRIAGMPKV